MEYGLRVCTTFVAFSYFCFLCNLLVLVLLLFFKYLYLKTEFGDRTMYEVLACLISISFGLFLEKGDLFLVFVYCNKRNICFCPTNKLVLSMKFVFIGFTLLGEIVHYR